ncbi:MAG: TonB family protein [Reichenbachiella sp.]
MKSIFIFSIIFFLTLLATQAQLNDKVVFFDDNWNECPQEKASYYGITEDYHLNKTSYKAIDYFISGAIQKTGNYSDAEREIKNGHFEWYYENGQLKEKGQYSKNMKTGPWDGYYKNGQQKEKGTYYEDTKKGYWWTWYENGQKKEEREVVGQNNYHVQSRNKVMSHWDSLGNQLVVKGNGLATYYHKDTLSISSSGSFKKGFKIGVWKGYSKDNRLKYEEIYKKNKVTGSSWNKDGIEFKYEQLVEQPEPFGGIRLFYTYLSLDMRYPNEAKNNKIEGIVLVQFEVDKYGKLIKVKTVKGIGSGCNKEAERVIKSSPKWNPGRQRGQPVKVKMFLPITFRLY